MYKIVFVLVVLGCSLLKTKAQSTIKQENNLYSRQYGFSVKGTLEVGTKHRPNPVYRLAAAGGIGSNFISSWLYPAFNLEVQVYNGGLGSKNKQKFFDSELDITAAFTLTGGTSNRFKVGSSQQVAEQRIPLYYFADFTFPALQNPFKHSFSIGTNLVFTPFNPGKKNQRIGFFNTHIGRMQVSYYNDGGTPFYQSYLGDRRDRYYTGGAVISYHGNASAGVNLIELSYHKFTGYTKNAFEASNKLYLSYIDYHEEGQQDYNKSLFSLNIANVQRGFGLHIRSYNEVTLDFQHMIHWGLYQAYHMVPYKPHVALGINYYSSHSKIGLQ